MTREEIITRLRDIVTENRGSVYFTMPDNCPGDGWDGHITEDKVYICGNNHFEGEPFSYDSPDIDTELLEEILEIIEDDMDV